LSLWHPISKEPRDCLNIKQNLSTAYHPESDGQTERINQILEQYLRIYVNYEQDNWVELLPLAEFSYNNSVHSTTKVSPFFANKGYNPLIDIGTARTQEVAVKASSLKDLQLFLQEEIKKANETYQKYADKDRKPPPEYKVDDLVWLSMENIKTTRPMKKLSEKRIGPFKIIEIVSKNAVRLLLPSYLKKLHPVFHVSLIEPFVPNTIEGRTQEPPPPIEIDGELEYEVEDIVDKRIRRNKEEYLVKWLGYDSDEDKMTWEPYENVKHLTDLLKKFSQRSRNTTKNRQN
jgi:Chromo (CHRromatin Organisation MOdifier) domain